MRAPRDQVSVQKGRLDDVFSPCEFDLARMLRFPMIAVDFLHIAHKIHRDHETAARAKAAGGRTASARPPVRPAPRRRGPQPPRHRGPDPMAVLPRSPWPASARSASHPKVIHPCIGVAGCLIIPPHAGTARLPVGTGTTTAALRVARAHRSTSHLLRVMRGAFLTSMMGGASADVRTSPRGTGPAWWH